MLRRLDDNVVRWIAGSECLVRFGVEVVLSIFCFPVAVWQSEGINNFTIRSDVPVTVWGCCIRNSVCLFTEQCEVGLVAIMLGKVLECSTDGAFVFFIELGVFFQFSVVGFDRFMRRLDVQIGYLFSPCLVSIRTIPYYTRSHTKLREEF